MKNTHVCLYRLTILSSKEASGGASSKSIAKLHLYSRLSVILNQFNKLESLAKVTFKKDRTYI